jgi:hypothetical protein
MSDNFIIRVLENTGTVVRLRAALTGSQDFDGMPYPDGRSFFLMMAYMEEPASSAAPESEWGPVRRALARELKDYANGTARIPFDLLQDAGWLGANIDRYVPQVTMTRTRLLSYEIPREEQVRFGQWLWNQAYGDGNTCADPDELYLEVAPFFEATVVFGQAEFTEHLPAGKVFGTAAYAALKEPPWSTPKLANAPDWVCEEFVAGPDGAPMPAPAKR